MNSSGKKEFRLIARCRHCHSTIDFAQRFWPKVDKTSHIGGCWVWKGAARSKGYGQIRGFDAITGKPRMFYAHRVAFQLVNGNISPGMHVCHTCDNPLCVNPTHLYEGTDADNTRDKIVRGRVRGPGMKFKKEQVLEIRRLFANGVTQAALTKQFEASATHIHRIVRRKEWKHV